MSHRSLKILVAFLVTGNLRQEGIIPSTKYCVSLHVHAASGGLSQQSCNTKPSDESRGYHLASHEQPDSSDKPTTPVDCGDGNGISLPIWNGTGKTFQADDWQFKDEWELTSDTRKLVKDFADLVLNTSNSLAQKVDPDVVVLWLRQLDSFMALCGTSMSRIKNMEELFMILSDYWSWWNYYLLEDLIKTFGDKEDETKLKEYHDKFTIFLKKRLPLTKSYEGW